MSTTTVKLTPQERAKELIHSCMNADINVPHSYSVHCAGLIASEVALQCKELERYWENDMINPHAYWLKVIDEINKYQHAQ